MESVAIDYVYDPLYRVRQAIYPGEEMILAYWYDAVGNRRGKAVRDVATSYDYDDANRLTSVAGRTYTWDDNGNLLDDGTQTYVYDQANRLKQVTQGANTYTFAYNGVGDRLSQTVGITTTRYVLDPAAGLTQVLADGTNTYLYGNGRLAQYQTAMQYFGADGLGSVRQIFDASGQVVGSTRYDPFGGNMGQSGTATSVFAFAGEQYDATGLTYLRARYYSAAQGRFVTRDVWAGDPNAPMSYNAWNYVSSNPVDATDPTGQWRWGLSKSFMYHEPIENHYEGTAMGTFNADKQVEFLIPGTRSIVDMFNSLEGDVYEIEPVGNEAEGRRQLQRYIDDLKNARNLGRLNSEYYRRFGGLRWDWFWTNFDLGDGWDWPPPHPMREPLQYWRWLDLVADYDPRLPQPSGLIIYWLEPGPGPIPVPMKVPNKQILRQRNWAPGMPVRVPQPAVYKNADCLPVVMIGVTAFLLLDDATGIGVIDDLILVGEGAYVFNVAQRMAAYVPVLSGP